MRPVTHVVAPPRATLHRYSIVRSLQEDAGACTLVVEDAAERIERIDVGSAPDRRDADELRGRGLHALSVKLELSRSGVLSCTALFSSAAGPVRLPVSSGAALALCADGRRTVVTRR